MVYMGINHPVPYIYLPVYHIQTICHVLCLFFVCSVTYAPPPFFLLVSFVPCPVFLRWYVHIYILIK